MDVTERIDNQRPRGEIIKELTNTDNLNSRLWVSSKVTLEVLLDIRDLLADMRDWLPSRD